MIFNYSFSLLQIALHSFYLISILFFSSPLLSSLLLLLSSSFVSSSSPFLFFFSSPLLSTSPLLLSPLLPLLLQIPLTTVNTSNKYYNFNSFLCEVKLLHTGQCNFTVYYNPLHRAVAEKVILSYCLILISCQIKVLQRVRARVLENHDTQSSSPSCIPTTLHPCYPPSLSPSLPLTFSPSILLTLLLLPSYPSSLPLPLPLRHHSLPCLIRSTTALTDGVLLVKGAATPIVDRGEGEGKERVSNIVRGQ